MSEETEERNELTSSAWFESQLVARRYHISIIASEIMESGDGKVTDDLLEQISAMKAVDILRDYFYSNMESKHE